MADVEIKGMRELYIALSTQIPRRMEGKILQKALTAGTSVVVKQAKINAVAGGNFPEKQTGTLQRAIYAKRGKTSTPEKEVRIISVRRGRGAAKRSRDAFYAVMVEYGHRIAGGKRLIQESRAKTKAGFDKYERKRARGQLKGEAPSRGFATPHPFMRPAWDTTKTRATERVVEKLRELVQQAVNGSRF